MTKSRKDFVLDSEKKSLFIDYPRDILYKIAMAADENYDLNSSAATDMLTQFSELCKTTHGFFRQNVNALQAKQLLTYVLTGNEIAVLEVAKANPRLFFIKATAEDYAKDLDGNPRIITKWSPYQAILGCGDRAMLKTVKPYLDSYLDTLEEGVIFNEQTYLNGKDLTIQQIQEKFPDGLNFPPCTDEFNRLVNDLAKNVTKDLQLQENWKNPTPETLYILKKFREYLKPGIVEMGHHCNMNNVIKTHRIYLEKWALSSGWNGQQLTFWAICIIGFQQRLLTAPYLQALIMGLDKYVNENKPLERCFVAEEHSMSFFHNCKKITVVPFTSENPFCRLGETTFIDSFCGGLPDWYYVKLHQTAPALEKLCQKTIEEFSILVPEINQHIGCSLSCTIS